MGSAKPGQTADWDTYLERYTADGYVIVPQLLDVHEDISPVIGEYDALINRLARGWLESGMIASFDPDKPLLTRLINLLEKSDGACFQSLDISLPLVGTIQHDTPMHHGQAVFDLIRNSKLLGGVEKFIGPEIYSNPVQHMRFKAPERCLTEQTRGSNTLIAQTFWHQDLGVIEPDADSSNILSVWIPILDTDEDNGCLIVAKGSHHGGLARHCRTASRNGIPEELVTGERVALPMRAGDVLFLNKCTMHASLPNRGNGLRWSADLRYNPIGEHTGRAWFPGFLCRSRSNPEAELRDASAWAARWRETRASLVNQDLSSQNRWSPLDPLCA